DLDSILLDDFTKHRALHIAAAFNGQIDNNASAFHRVNHFSRHDCRRFSAKDLGGGDHDIGFRADLLHSLALLFELLIGELSSVTVFGLAGFADIDFDEARAQRANLLFDDWPGVESIDPSPETPGSRNGLETRYAGADDKYTGRTDRAGRSHHHGKNPV